MFCLYFALALEITIKMLIITGVIFSVVVLYYAWRENREVVYPWAKEEERAAKKAAKEAERARREFWQQ